MRAATYSRFSSDKQDRDSIVGQQREARKLAAREGWTVVMDFVDEGISGEDSRRPGYLAMRAAAERKDFDALILYALSRLCRDSAEQTQALRSLEFHGVRVITVTGGYDSSSGNRKIIGMVTGLQDEMANDVLRAQITRGLHEQALKGFWCGGRPYGYRLKPVLDPSKLDAYGRPEQIGTRLEPDPAQASVVKEIFHMWAIEGLPCVAIAERVNARGTPSPGSSWRRKTRRCGGWMQSAIRGILKNPLYTGRQRWNAVRIAKNPDTNKYVRRKRPEAEHVTKQIEGLRLVADATFEKAAARFRSLADGDPRLKSGGRPRHLLSGQLRCAKCGSSYVLADRHKYACAGYIGGRACSNNVWVRKDALEEKIVRPLDQAVLEPKRVAKAVAWMQSEYGRRMRAARARSAEVPAEIAALDARLARLKTGAITDLEPDELAAAIARIEVKRRDLLGAATSGAKSAARVFDALPRAAATFRATVAQGLAGNPAAVAEARLILRPMLGPITLTPDEGGALWASYGIDFSVLAKATGTGGRGDRI